MPLNTLRLNHLPSTYPNDRIIFIKPLPRPASNQSSYDLADTFLHAIAAQCLPVMKKHHLSVTTLEEYEPNPEFIGRNFNNGEVIQLVLSTRSGGWIPFNMVQMVMMHELAHNLQMNHGKNFWAERNKFANEMKELWAKGYTGDGFWGSGRTLENLQAVAGNNILPSAELADLHVCGGTFRSRPRKRKRRGAGRQDLTSREKRDRRIEKKFGKNGQVLGEDEGARTMLEIGKNGPIGGKPRVANSKRGRELRAAAALARFEANKAEVESLWAEERGDDSEYEDDDADLKAEDVKDHNGRMLLDTVGFEMVRVCEDVEDDDIQVKQEKEELSVLNRFIPDEPRTTDQGLHSPFSHSAKRELCSLYDIPQYRGSPTPPVSPRMESLDLHQTRTPIMIHRLPKSKADMNGMPAPPSIPTQPDTITNDSTGESSSAMTVNCPICFMSNDRFNPTCVACAHVLDTRKDPGHWRCNSETCQGRHYVNAGDCGVCGICGGRKE